MIKIIEKHNYKDRTFKKLYKINSLSELKNLKLRDDMKFYYKGVELDLNNPVLPQEPTSHDNSWKDLKEQITKMSIFEFVESIYVLFETNEYFFRLDEYYIKNNKPYIEMVLDVYTEEVIIYVVDSCNNGIVKGNFKVVPVRELENADEILHRPERRRNELEYQGWKNHIYDMIAHDFKNNYKYETIAMEGLINGLKSKTSFQDRIIFAIDYLKFNSNVVKYVNLNSYDISVKFVTNSIKYFDITKAPYKDLIKYKNIPIEEMTIQTLRYNILINEKGVYTSKKEY